MIPDKPSILRIHWVSGAPLRARLSCEHTGLGVIHPLAGLGSIEILSSTHIHTTYTHQSCNHHAHIQTHS